MKWLQAHTGACGVEALQGYTYGSGTWTSKSRGMGVVKKEEWEEVR